MQRGGGGSWTPAAIAGLLSLRDVGGGLSKCYTTTGGSTLSTDGTAAAKVLDAKNATYNALASSSAPTYRVGANGKPYLEFNGSGNRYDNLNLNPTFSAHCLNISAAGYHNIYDTPGNALTGRMLWVDTSRRPEADATIVVGTALTVGTWYTVFVARGPSTTEMWINGVSVGTSATIRATVATIAEFNRGGASTFNGKISSWVYGSSRPTATELSLLHSYMMGNVPT
jgi:hypothetical protein